MTNKLALPMREIIALYRSGMSMDKLGEKYGCDNETIGRHLRAAKIRLRPSAARLSAMRAALARFNAKKSNA